jgi:hypothetical protein
VTTPILSESGAGVCAGVPPWAEDCAGVGFPLFGGSCNCPKAWPGDIIKRRRRIKKMAIMNFPFVCISEIYLRESQLARIIKGKRRENGQPSKIEIAPGCPNRCGIERADTREDKTT